MNPRPTFVLRRLNAALFIALSSASAAQAQTTLQEVVVTANRQEQRSFDAPASIQAVGQDVIEAAGPRINLSESLNRVPGITALNRQNYAQDLQLSIRGSGSRSPFGIRGVRLIVDGIPATMPDGQGQASTVSLGSAQRIEVLRGPLAQLYGNAAGGVVQVFTADGPATPEAGFSLLTGSNGLRRYGLNTGGQSGALNYLVDYSRFETDGQRPNSAAQRRHLNAKLRLQASEDTRYTLIANAFDQPESGDPLGLTRAQLAANPQQTDSRSIDAQAGKDVSQNQIGLVAEHRLNPDSGLTARVYAGERDLDNRLAIPLFVQQVPTAAGGVVNLDRSYSGVGLQYRQRVKLGEGQVETTLGLDHDRMDERRRGYINNLGVQGELKRDEDDAVNSTGVYAQANWAVNADWSAVAGLRSSRVNFRVRDRFINDSNPDDSGSADFSATSPVLGLTRHFGETTNVYLNVGRGFETPTLTEIAYRSEGSGPNLALKAAKSLHTELGVKTRLAEGHRLDAAAFLIGTDDEIVVASSSGGRSIYTNAGKTRRSGFELAYTGDLGQGFSTHWALSTLNARFVDAFASAGGATVASGNRIPGTLNRSVFGEFAWRPASLPGFSTALELVHQGGMFVDDVNSDRTQAYTVFNLRMGLEQKLGGWRLREFLRLDNVSDKAYVGSVIANDGNRRFFEPAPGRSWSLGVTANYAFSR
ncbi:MAG: TonB-dependent receptor [Hydrogenophaga sp.]|uniref:TonB-dependent receptor family protein n=1 Tax=Hydrogenophaga sp. TaxID=1904254 RepID=UPI0025BA63F1|nr:TonB-dependent receptor [Hydrogenophaga sp.]MBT9554138.1 TonB-dependent receptor [Hydrogenophaga sp.]